MIFCKQFLFVSLAVIGPFMLSVSVALAADFYVSPTGSSANSGTIDSPWTLDHALDQPAAVQPGDTIWVRGGTYSGNFTSSLTGTAADPIIVRNYNNERAKIVTPNLTASPLYVSGGYTWYWGLEFEVTDTTPSDVQTVDVHATGTRIINTIIHNGGGNGLGLWSDAPDSEAYGNIIFGNGIEDNYPGGPNGGRSAHGIYSQNETGYKKYEDNIVFDNYGYGFHIYTENSALNNISADGNISFGNGREDGMNYHFGGGAPLVGLVFTNNLGYSTGASDRFGYNFNDESINVNGTITDNYFIGSQMILYRWGSLDFLRNVMTTEDWENIIMTLAGETASSSINFNNNTYYKTGQGTPFTVRTSSGGSSADTFEQWQALGLDEDSTYIAANPTETHTMVEPNDYEDGRGNIGIYNPGGNATVSVDVSSIGVSAGDTYELHNVQDYFDDVVTGTASSGGVISVPMTGHTVEPTQLNDTATSWFPTFGAFVLICTSACDGTPSADTTAPSVSITSPSAGTSIDTSATVSASASDNVGVVGVQFRYGSTNIGSEDTSSPYSVTWDTTALTEGSYSLTAVARDAAGNYATSSAISITVDHPEPPTDDDDDGGSSGGGGGGGGGGSSHHSPSSNDDEDEADEPTDTTELSDEPSIQIPVITTPATVPVLLHISTQMSLGSTGADVTALQKFLIHEGHLGQGNATGFYGFATEMAVKRFQEQAGIVSSGTPNTTGYGAVGPQTLARINARIDLIASSSSGTTIGSVDRAAILAQIEELKALVAKLLEELAAMLASE